MMEKEMKGEKKERDKDTSKTFSHHRHLKRQRPSRFGEQRSAAKAYPVRTGFCSCRADCRRRRRVFCQRFCLQTRAWRASSTNGAVITDGRIPCLVALA